MKTNRTHSPRCGRPVARFAAEMVARALFILTLHRRIRDLFARLESLLTAWQSAPLPPAPMPPNLPAARQPSPRHPPARHARSASPAPRIIAPDRAQCPAPSTSTRSHTGLTPKRSPPTPTEFASPPRRLPAFPPRPLQKPRPAAPPSHAQIVPLS